MVHGYCVGFTRFSRSIGGNLELPDGGASCQAEEAAVEGTRDAKRSNGTAEDAWAGLVMAAVGRRARQVALDLRSRRSGTKKQV